MTSQSVTTEVFGTDPAVNKAVKEGDIMLVLTRKVGEEIVIGGDVKITVVSIGPCRVKLGVEAPRETAIDRGEVHERKMDEQKGTQAGRA
jgi:carbon storage regulator